MTISENQQLSFGINGERHTLADGINSPFVKAGTDPSPVPVNKLFDDARDNALIQKGSHFFCASHLKAVPIENRSPRNPKYCCECLAVIENDRQEKNNDSWIANDQIFITGHKAFGIHSAGATVCLGNESDIKQALATRTIPESIWGIPRLILEKIIMSLEKEGKYGESDRTIPTMEAGLRAPNTKQRNNFRVRSLVASRRVALNAKLPSIKQQSAIYSDEQNEPGV